MKLDTSNLASCCRRFWSAAFFLLALVPIANAQDATTLKERYGALSSRLVNNQFQRPIYLESSENAGDLKGDIYALLEQPYAGVGAALQGADHWCDILILHLNVKSCQVSKPLAGDTLSLHIGRKYDQPLADAYLFEFLYRLAAKRADYLQVMMNAEQGPLGTSHYRILLEVVELDSRHSFLHLSYAYVTEKAARVAAQIYLATVGRNKVGFSIIGTKKNGRPVFIGGTRGVVERNAMRVYLAIDAYLNALSVPAPQQIEKRLNQWYSGAERYPVQLHELERAEYLSMKRKEISADQRRANVQTEVQKPLYASVPNYVP